MHTKHATGSAKSLPALTMAVGALSVLLAIVAAAWAGAVAMGCARRIWAGTPLGLDLLTSMPFGLSDLALLLIMASVLLVERLAHGPDHFPLTRLLDRTRYDLFFVLADATGALKAFALAFSFGLSAWIGAALSDTPALLALGETSLWLQVPVIYVVMSFCSYWMHRFMHTPLVWPLHAMHHAAEDMTALTDSRLHPLDDLIQSTPIMVVLALLGFHPDALFLAVLVIRTQAALCHSDAPFPLWLESWFVSGPALHRIHHGAAPEHHDRNFGVLVLWDRLFGTFSLVPNARAVRTGVDDSRYNTGKPLHDMVTIAGIWLAGLSAALRRWRRGPLQPFPPACARRDPIVLSVDRVRYARRTYAGQIALFRLACPEGGHDVPIDPVHCVLNRRAFLSAPVLAALAPNGARAQPREAAGSVQDFKNEAFAQAGTQRRALAQASPIFVSDLVTTGPASRLRMQLGRDTTVLLGERARLVIDRFVIDVGGELNLLSGAMLFARPAESPPQPVQIRSAFGLIAVRGTRFFAGPSGDVFGVFVESGTLSVSGAGREVVLRGGEGTDIAAAGQAPTDPRPWGEARIRAALESVN